ncbi:phospholipase C, phosphocholine-specific [Sphingomonas sp. DG1-23]|uniref:phosphocholine-specific phospholipase C n=1 Tax=Sphingomonas sp. DG1-23 TaxID=3068316 RepID=UPI00273FFB76|nr:phospholipase C, phosphocholine-specific [Sphingomonas sp. DG1-23]MDP5280850.1 phospholipase C, phosphocholine-specific [Sphingomonas sp. DG1-23]
MTHSLEGRRAFIKAMMAAGGAASGLLPSIARALDIPAHRRTGTIMDVEHVVILTQENRSFDHYFGAMHGVRGFGDRFAILAPPLPGAPDRTVFVQPNQQDGATPALVAPFRLDTVRDFRLYRPLGTPHGFPDSQAAWDNGRLGGWPKHKQNQAMAYFTREDIPFQYALAEAFTLCDAYHCALHLSTNPNRLYIWTGTHDPQARGNGPAIDNGYDGFEDPRGHGGYIWKTYPERLLDAGVSFQIYQDMADNFSDNPLVGFRRYRDARSAKSGPDAELVRRTMTTRTLDQLKGDVLADRLPQVSWIVAPTAWSEHPSVSTPLQGAEYTAQLLDALTANPQVWAKTVLLINFDENDGLFDHVPPPAPPARDKANPARSIGSTTIAAEDEYHLHSQSAADAAYLGRPYGLGPRVPMYVVSPWSAGGYVASEVFDHTSVIRFLETRFGVREPNISAWRRAVCGDLTSCFDFARPDHRNFLKKLPETRALSERASILKEVRPDLPPAPAAPIQEAGLRRRRATPYALEAYLAEAAGEPMLHLVNDSADRAAVFHLYCRDRLDADPARHTVGAGERMLVPLGQEEASALDLFLLGPNGFHRSFGGAASRLTARIETRGRGMATLRLENRSELPRTLEIRDLAYGQPSRRTSLAPRQARGLSLKLEKSHGWYDIGIEASGMSLRMAGHVENGEASYSDPAAYGAATMRSKTR